VFAITSIDNDIRAQHADGRHLLLRRSPRGYDGYAGLHLIHALDVNEERSEAQRDYAAVTAAFRFDAAATAHEQRHGCKNAFRCPLAADDFESFPIAGESREIICANRPQPVQPPVDPHRQSASRPHAA
jgi:hypothetical protein